MSQYEIDFEILNPMEAPEHGIMTVEAADIDQAEYDATQLIKDASPEASITINHIKELPDNG